MKIRANHYAFSHNNDPRVPEPFFLVFSEDSREQACVSMTRRTAEALLEFLSRALKVAAPCSLEKKVANTAEGEKP